MLFNSIRVFRLTGTVNIIPINKRWILIIIASCFCVKLIRQFITALSVQSCHNVFIQKASFHIKLEICVTYFSLLIQLPHLWPLLQIAHLALKPWMSAPISGRKSLQRKFLHCSRLTIISINFVG